MFEEFNGPHFDLHLIGTNGKMSRLHKGGAKQQDPPPPSPIQKTADATEAADILTRDRKRLRNSFLDSTIAGEGIGGSGSGGNQFLG